MTNEHAPPTDEECIPVLIFNRQGEEIARLDENGRLTFGKQTDIPEAAQLFVDAVHRIWSRKQVLTLPNGVEVRAGDVLVNKKIGKVVRVTAVGEKQALGETLILHDGEWTGMVDEHPLFTYAGQRDWHPWSEIYPDQPVPGGEE